MVFSVKYIYESRLFFFWQCFVPLQGTVTWESKRWVGTSGRYRAAPIFVYPVQGRDFFFLHASCTWAHRFAWVLRDASFSFTMQGTHYFGYKGVGLFHSEASRQCAPGLVVKAVDPFSYDMSLIYLLWLIFRLYLIARSLQLSLFPFYFICFYLICSLFFVNIRLIVMINIYVFFCIPVIIMLLLSRSCDYFYILFSYQYYLSLIYICAI